MRGTSWVAVLLVILIGSAVGIAGGTFLAVVLPSMRATHTGIGDLFGGAFGGKPYVHILMIGEDDTSKRNSNHNGLSDTLVVLAVETQTKDIRAISIPRDTMVEVPGHGTCKINAAHVYGGPELSRQVVSSLLGTPIDYHIKTNTTGLRGLVDLVGGVYIIVDKDMHYTDRHGGLYIDLHASPNKQLLNGKQAEGYVRFRHDLHGDAGYDIRDGERVPAGRIVRQQYFVRALVNRILALPSKRERAKVLETAYKRHYIVSDLNLKDWDGLADFFKDIDPEKVRMAVLPGAPGSVHGASYWLPDQNEIVKCTSEYMLFQDPPARIEVLNGSGVAGLAKQVADKLQSEGFDVARTENAPRSDYDRSRIITNKGKSEPAQRIASIMGCGELTPGHKDKDVDVTVIVGRDYVGRTQ
jgi:polyisoprenyl-teichoic acid--peptidoglycan teichoic acid transferase